MTIQQEAYQLIDTLPEDSVKIIVQLMYKLKPQPTHQRKNFSFSDYITPTDRADYAEKYVRELRDHDRI